MWIDMAGIKANILHVRPSVRRDRHDRLPYISILEIYEYISKCLNLFNFGKNMGYFFKHLYVSF